MYGLVRQTFPPTSTNDCLSCNLTGDAHEKNLVVAGSTVLTVYGLREPRRTSVTGERARKKNSELVHNNRNVDREEKKEARSPVSAQSKWNPPRRSIRTHGIEQSRFAALVLRRCQSRAFRTT